MLHIGRARHPGPGPRDITLGQLSIEFINVGGWLTSGDLAFACSLLVVLVIVFATGCEACCACWRAWRVSSWQPVARRVQLRQRVQLMSSAQ